MPPPVIAVVQQHPQQLLELVERRFGREYAVEAHSSVDSLASASQRLAASGRRLALVLADRVLGLQRSIPTLAGLRDVHADVLRCVLLPFGDQAAAEEIVAAVAVGDIDRYLATPWSSPDVGLYPALTELLADWWRTTTPTSASPVLVRVVAPPLSPRTHELRDLLDRNRIPALFAAFDSDLGHQLRASTSEHVGPDDVVLELPDGRVLVNPANRMIAHELGARTAPARERVDVVVAGGGPSGLAAALYAGSEGLRTVVIERAALGGQAGTSSNIRNYPGFPHGVSGTELASRASEQGWLFGVEFVNTNGVERFAPTADGRHRVTLSDGTTLTTRAVVLALGVEYRRLAVPGVERLIGAGVYYGAARAEAPGFAGRRVYIVGAGNSAGQAAVHLAGYAEVVTLLVRGPGLAASMSDYLVRQLERTGNIAVQRRTEVVRAAGAHHLESLELRADGRLQTVAADGLFILIGAEPRTEWLPDAVRCDEHGFVLTDSDLPDEVTALPYETSVPGVFAVGDVRHGSVKRVASAVGEGAVCISSVHRRLDAQAAHAAREAQG